MRDIFAELSFGDIDSVKGADITIERVWSSDGYQVGTGLDDQGRRLVFSISLTTGVGHAKLL